MNALIRLALKYRPLVVMTALAVMVIGSYRATELPIDILPDLDRARVVVMAECGTLPAEDVEILVVRPLEISMQGAPGVDIVRSQCTAGFGIVYVEFDWKTDVRTARQIVIERLAIVNREMPEGVVVTLGPPASVMGQILQVGISSGNGETSETQLGTLAEWEIRPRIMAVTGVSEVILTGGERKQYVVQIHPEKLAEFGISFTEVQTAIRASNLNSDGGFAIQGGREKPIRVLARLGPDPDQVKSDLGKIPVKVTPLRSVLLRDIAVVTEGEQLKRGDASVNGKPAIVMTVVKQPHADTRRVTEAIHRTLYEMEATLPDDVTINHDLFQLKGFIDRGVFNVGEALVLGAALVLVVLTLFLMNLRTTFITLTAIPLSVATTVVIFDLIGRFFGTQLTVNVMTLGGLAVAMGELVDDAIVDVENIYRRLRENRSLGLPKTPLRVIYEASLEVRGAVVYGTAVVILVFLPLFALSGIEGRLFAPLGVAYVLSILASLFISLTVTPVLSYYLLGRSRHLQEHHDGLLLRGLKAAAKPLICLSMNNSGLLLVLTWIFVGFCAFLMTRLGADFLPAFDEGSVQMNVSLPAGSSLDASNEVCAAIDKKLITLKKSETNPDGLILNFLRRTGRAFRDEHVEPVNKTEYILSMNPESPLHREETLSKLLTELKEEVPGVDIEVEQPLAHLISHMLTGVKSQIAVKVQGDDLETIQRTAENVKRAIADVPGVVSPVVEAQSLTDEIHIRPRADDLAFYGVTRKYLAEYLQAALYGVTVSEVVDGSKRYDLVVRFADDVRKDYPKLRDLRIELPQTNQLIMLHELANVEDGLGPNAVSRENVRRRLVVRCNVKGRDLAGTAADVEKALRDEVEVPQGYTVELGGQFESQQRATTLISVLACLSFIGMFMILLIPFPSTRVVLQILNALPTAFIGGVLALVLTHQTLTVAAMVGFVSLGGIAVRNGILLVSHYIHLLKHEGEIFSPEMVIRGSLERLAPVLMTALTAGIALVPLVLDGQKPGREILYPVATVILGGLVTSTFCEFLIHPGLFWRFSGKDAERLARPANVADDFGEHSR